MADLLTRVEAFLAQTGMYPSQFGELTAHDKRFVFDLRNGRTPRQRVTARTDAFMAEYPSTTPARKEA